MVFKSTYFSFSVVCGAMFLCSCVMQPLSENYSSSTDEYNNARNKEIASNIVEQSARRQANNVATPIQNPNNVPVIINDPFAVSNSIANNAITATGLGGNVYVNTPQGVIRSNPYGSLVNSENNVITPNVMMQNRTGFAPYQQPTFGSNYYRPY